MSFVDVRFLVFFPVVVLLHFLLPARFRWIFLLLASYAFYMAWKPEYGLLLALITLIDFTAGQVIGKSENARVRTSTLILSLGANLGILFYFKYFNFFFASIGSALGAMGSTASIPVLDIILPIGISFHIFQSISYTIDVYRKTTEPVTHLGKFALYVSFFPQLVAGPIERPKGLLVQFFEDRRFDPVRAREGVQLMMLGYAKKVVIADNLGPIVDAVYRDPQAFPGPSLAIATILFAYQLYCDFSGYTDIARGSAKILGYDLAENFRQPYAATSVADFWRRWHISLSSWLRDYLYTPLVFSGKKRTALRMYMSLLITFALIGLWHGASWTYVVMGILHGMYLVCSTITSRWSIRKMLELPDFLKTIVVFLLVSFTWIFFRAATTADAFYIATHLGHQIPEFLRTILSLQGVSSWIFMGTSMSSGIVAILGIVLLEIGETMVRDGKTPLKLVRGNFTPHILAGGALVLILVLGTFARPEQFIYFQF